MLEIQHWFNFCGLNQILFRALPRRESLGIGKDWGYLSIGMSCVPQQCTCLTLQWVTHATQIVKMTVLILQKAIRHYVHSELYKRLYCRILKKGPINKLTNRLQTILSIRVGDKQSRAKQQDKTGDRLVIPVTGGSTSV